MHFRHISAYYQVISNCEAVSLLQFYKFIKFWQWCLKGNELMRLNKLPQNKSKIFRILYQICTKAGNQCFYLWMVYLSLLDGFLWFPIKTFCSHALKCQICQKVNNCNEVNDHFLFMYFPKPIHSTWPSTNWFYRFSHFFGILLESIS